MNQAKAEKLLALTQAYAWFVPYLFFQHKMMGPGSGSQDMGLMSIIPAGIWAALVSLAISIVFFYRNQKFPWSNLLLAGVVAVPISVSTMFLGINLEVIGIIYRLGGLIPAGRRGWETFDVVAMTLILIAGFVGLKRPKQNGQQPT